MAKNLNQRSYLSVLCLGLLAARELIHVGVENIMQGATTTDSRSAMTLDCMTSIHHGIKMQNMLQQW